MAFFCVIILQHKNLIENQYIIDKAVINNLAPFHIKE